MKTKAPTNYAVYVGNVAVWEYVSFTWLEKRLWFLARFTPLASVEVYTDVPWAESDETVTVTFTRTKHHTGWSAEPKGIPVSRGRRSVNHSKSNRSLTAKETI